MSPYRAETVPATFTCAGCGRLRPPSESFYSGEGELVCRSCHGSPPPVVKRKAPAPRHYRSGWAWAHGVMGSLMPGLLLAIVWPPIALLLALAGDHASLLASFVPAVILVLGTVVRLGQQAAARAGHGWFLRGALVGGLSTLALLAAIAWALADTTVVFPE